MEIPGLGSLIKDDQWAGYVSGPVSLPILGGIACRIILTGYDGDPRPDDFRTAVANLLRCPPSVLLDASQHIAHYCEDINSQREAGDPELVPFGTPEDLWRHVQLGTEIYFSRNDYLDQDIYASIECECDWEPEHGLQIVLHQGLKVTKVGPYDGHETTARAYADPTLVGMIYKRI